MAVAILIDFGSTYTKVAAVDLEQDTFIGRAQAPSTVDTNVTQGLSRAIHLLKEQTGITEPEISLRLACSSAAGGLRMVAIGLIGRLTAEAANRAALGAGAKVVGVMERKLNWRTVEELEASRPDVILLAGGTDGGNHEVILLNAQVIAQSRVNAPVVVAGNEEATERVLKVFQEVGQPCYPCSNVMPTLQTLNVEPAREVIQEVFIEHIVKAKGLEQAIDHVGDIIMPTPMAVLRMAELLATGVEGESGIGDTVVIDIGGATTDIHSATKGTSKNPDIPMLGLEEPFAKRTVEGDLGLRVSARSLMDAYKRYTHLLPLDLLETLRTAEAATRAEYLSENTSSLPSTTNEKHMDTVMASAASWMAMERHAGVLVSDGRTARTVQFGKDLSEVNVVIGTGGVFASGADPAAPLSASLYHLSNPFSLRPSNPELYIDNNYIMYAGGLLATRYPEKAIRLIKKSLHREHLPASLD